MALNIKLEERETGTWVVCPEGRLDSNTAPAFEQRITPLLVPETKALILDLGTLTYLSSAGVRVVFKIRKTLTSFHAAFIMTNLQPQIRKVFEILNALPEVAVFESLEEVDRYLDAMQAKEIEERKHPRNISGGDDV